jgi:hypothetical protein
MVFLVNEGHADFALSDDSDLMVFGCKKVLYKLSFSDQRNQIFRAQLFESHTVKPPHNDLDYLRQLAMVTGCDYLNSIKGIGPKKADAFMKSVGVSQTDEELARNLKRMPNRLNMTKIVVTDEYVKNFIDAQKIFKYQLVFCPKEHKLVPLTPYPDGLTSSDLSFAGKYLEPEIATQLAFGNLCIETLTKLEDEFEIVRDHLSGAKEAAEKLREERAMRKLDGGDGSQGSQGSYISQPSSQGSGSGSSTPSGTPVYRPLSKTPVSMTLLQAAHNTPVNGSASGATSSPSYRKLSNTPVNKSLTSGIKRKKSPQDIRLAELRRDQHKNPFDPNSYKVNTLKPSGKKFVKQIVKKVEDDERMVKKSKYWNADQPESQDSGYVASPVDVVELD